MNEKTIQLLGVHLSLRASGAIFWAEEKTLCVSDLHMGRSDRIVRRGGGMLPPYETRDTLARLDQEIETTGARKVICLGDSFDDLAAADSIAEDERLWLARLQAGREWMWIEGNHDPGPVDLGGSHLAEAVIGPLTFRHIARPGAKGEVSGHYHPKARLATRGRLISRPAFLADDARLIMPAFGTYTGGLCWTDPAYAGLLGAGARGYLTGRSIIEMPMPIHAAAE